MRPFLSAEWRNLLMLNYEIDPAALVPFVPAGTELDSHNGRVFASIVAFQFLNTRVLGIPVPFHRHFSELNLRFYVRRALPGEVRRAVVFIREVVPRAAIAMVAQAVYNEPYLHLPIRGSVVGAPPAVHYEWRQAGRWHTLDGRAEGTPTTTSIGSHEEFITDHAWGYTRQRDGGTIEYRVAHERWPVWRAARVAIHADLAGLYGSALAAQMQRPFSAFIVPGSHVTVSRPIRVAARAAA